MNINAHLLVIINMKTQEHAVIILIALLMTMLALRLTAFMIISAFMSTNKELLTNICAQLVQIASHIKSKMMARYYVSILAQLQHSFYHTI